MSSVPKGGIFIINLALASRNSQDMINIKQYDESQNIDKAFKRSNFLKSPLLYLAYHLGSRHEINGMLKRDN